MTKFQKRLWTGIGIMALISPIGIILPEKFKAGDAWGEWGPDKIKEMLGYVPTGLEKLSGLWNSPLPDYGFGEGSAPAAQYIGYIVSGLLGVALAGLIVILLSKILLKNLKNGQ